MQVASFFAPVRAESENPIPFLRIARLTRAFILVTALATVGVGVVAAAAADPGSMAASGAAEAMRPERAGNIAEPGEPAPPSATAPSSSTATSAPTPEPKVNSGPAYRVVSTDGGIYTHGWFDFAGSASGASTSPVVGLAQSDDGEGYWVATSDGGVFSFGDAAFYGSATDTSAADVTDIESSASHRGYWLAGADGGVFAFGDAGYFGSAVDLGLNKVVVSLAGSPTGNGYWLAAADGGVFSFGDAEYFGALADQPVNARIVDIVPTPTGKGYYLVAADGGVFTFGDAVFQGTAANERLTKPISGMTLHPEGDGYWLLSGDGGVFSYGKAPYLGAPVATGAKGTFVAIAGGTGRHEPAPVPEPVVVPEPTPAPPVAAAAPPPIPESASVSAAGKGRGQGRKRGFAPKPERQLDHEFGWDISYPQCGGTFPTDPAAFNIIGVNGGRAFKHNKCLGEQWQWARARGAAGIYVNVHYPRSAQELAAGATSDRQADCNGVAGCVAYNFGLNGLRDSLAYARSQGVDAPFVWLDIEQLNYWSPYQDLNAVVIRGAVDAAREAGLGVGIYSTPYQYKKLTGDEQAQVPVWTAGAPGGEAVADYCVTRGFAGGPVVLVQLLPGQFDPNFACPGAGPMSRYFAMP